MKFHGYTIYPDGTIIGKRGKPLNPSDNGRGYKIVGINMGKERKTYGVHRLVALMYVPNPFNYKEVDHIDGDKSNNSFENLRWCTRGDNIQYAYDLNKRSAKGECNARSILTEEQVHEVCALLSQGYSCAKIRDKGYPYVPVQGIKYRKNWRYISDSYAF